MVAPLFVPADGRITSLQILNIALTGGEVIEIVSPGNAAQGNNFQVTTAVLGAYFSQFGFASPTIIKSGATIGSPYGILATDTVLLFNKTAGAASYASAPLAASMLSPGPVLIKDFKGDAFTNNITTTFSGGELCDGQANVVIKNSYGWVRIAPNPGGGGWYQV